MVAKGHHFSGVAWPDEAVSAAALEHRVELGRGEE
jgi:hypothetical protein